MSEQATEDPGQDEGIDLHSLSGDAAFGALMGALVAETEEGEATAGEAAETAAAPEAGADGAAGSAGQAGQAGAAPDPAAADAGGKAPAADAASETGAGAPADAGSSAPGAEGAPSGDAAADAAGSGGSAVPADWTAEPAAIAPKLSELSKAFEEKVAQEYQDSALEATRKEYPLYFEALEKHPRLLVGQQVPSIDKEGMEVLRDSDDAREWQEAVKSVLVQEVRSRASTTADENQAFLETVHASIELFQNNADLVPGTKGFDVELANRFATMAKPYELRVDGKLRGYTIPVQPIIDQLRTAVKAERAASKAPAAPAAPAAGDGGGAPATPPKPPEAPQAGIQSKAGSGDNVEDFSTLFGTIGLPNLRI